MTIAGMNLASVATIRVGSIGTLNVTSLASINSLNLVSQLSTGGLALTSLASIRRLNLADSISFTSLASAPNIVRSNVGGDNVVIQKSTYSLASLGGSAGVDLSTGRFGAWGKTFNSLTGAWATIDSVGSGNSQLLVVDTMRLSSATQPGTRLEAPGAGASSGVVISVYGIGSVNGGIA